MGLSRSVITSVQSTSMRRGFTIVELIVVILIIVVISAILLPALGGARDVAKKTATTQLINNLIAAAGRFEQDQRRLPGYFSPTEMGHPEQFAGAGSGRGMSAMENIMIDLAGGIPQPPTGTTGGGSGGGMGGAPEPTSLATAARNVGPTRDRANQIHIDTALIGVKNGSFAPYFVPDNKYYVAQTSSARVVQQNAAAPHSDRPDKIGNQLPDVVDAFGTPLLAWVQDESATQPIGVVEDFAREKADGTNRARFYWNSNSCFLSATGAGKKQIDMQKQSLLGGGPGATTPVADRMKTLAALLGNPGYPNDRSESAEDMLPTAARGRFVVHAAGADGVYLGRNEAGAKLGFGSSPENRYLAYGLNFKNKSDALHLDDKDQPTVIDVLDDFDDIVVSGGN